MHWSDSDITYLRDTFGKIPAKTIAEKIGRRRQAVLRMAARLELKISDEQRIALRLLAKERSVAAGLGSRVCMVRRTRIMSQESLAERSGVSRCQVNRIERNALDTTVSTAQKIAESLGVSIDFLCGSTYHKLLSKIATDLQACVTKQNEDAVQSALGEQGWDLFLRLLDAINPVDGKESHNVGSLTQDE